MSGPSGPRGALGEYRVIRSIAQGANAQVKLGQHTLTGAVVALKFISRTWIQEANIQSQVSREIQYMRLLRHPHITKLYEVITTRTHVILVMEYAQDELFSVIERGGRLTEDQARPWFQQLMYALAYSHSLKVVHRDLKPENILLGEDPAQRGRWNLKIADFGLSNEWHDGDWLKTGCGTPHYAAPEVVQGNLYGVEVDVWSCGAILYVMVCGRLPFDEDTMPMLFHRINHADYHIPDDLLLSPALLSLLQGMMTVDPTKRLTVPEILAHEWTRQETPRYLRQIYKRHTPIRPPPLLKSLSSLVGSGSPNPDGDDIDLDMPWNETIVQELSDSIGVEFSAVMDALLSSQENAVKVAYALRADQDAGYDLRPVGEQEVVDQLTAPGSAPPSRHLPNPTDMLDQESDDDDEEEDDEEAVMQLEWRIPSTFALLSIQSTSSITNGHAAPLPSTSTSSGPGISRSPDAGSSHAAATAAAHAAEHSERRRRRHLMKPKPPLWHFGIRSVSQRMEVILELYKSLQSLGIEWREKRGPWIADAECCATDEAGFEPIQDAYAYQGASKDDLDIFTLELRWRKRNIVALMKLRLYQTPDNAFVVDFVWQGHYKASTRPNATKFEREDSLSQPPSDARMRIPRRSSSGQLSISQSASPVLHKVPKAPPQPMLNPMLFFELATELIAELTGEGGPTSSLPTPTG